MKEKKIANLIILIQNVPYGLTKKTNIPTLCFRSQIKLQ